MKFGLGIEGDYLRARVIAPKHEYCNCTFEVEYLSYDNVAGRERHRKDVIAASFDEIEFMYDSTWEEAIINNREILNIKKPKKASYYMYYAILKSIEAHVGNTKLELFILEENEIQSKKVWTKKIVAYGDNHPISIDITGQNYLNKFDIKITDISNNEFIYECKREIEKLEIGLKSQTKRINGLTDIMQTLHNEKMYTSTQELSLQGA